MARSKYYGRYRNYQNTYQRKYHKTIRARLVEIMGSRCSNPDCLVPGGCTDVRCLQIDHINGGGSLEGLVLGSYKLMMNYIRHPEEIDGHIQLLCANCNWIKKHTNSENRGIYDPLDMLLL